MKNKTKALIKDLELQIDYLISYSPQGLHWKQEYGFRETLLNNTLCDASTPQETIDKIACIQDTLHKLRTKETHEQTYLNADNHHQAQVNDYMHNEFYTIDL